MEASRETVILGSLGQGRVTKIPLRSGPCVTWSWHVEDVLGLLDDPVGRNPGHGLLHGYRAWPHCGWALWFGHRHNHVSYQSAGTKENTRSYICLREHEKLMALANPNLLGGKCKPGHRLSSLKRVSGIPLASSTFGSSENQPRRRTAAFAR
jgi:hypothetical protein